MDSNYTHISFLLDRSGSMSSIWKDVVGGFKSFIDKQKELAGKCTFSLSVFDEIYDEVINFKPLNSVKGIPPDIQPRNMTALLDSMAKAIINTGKKLKEMSEKERPSKVIFVVQTDGQENASVEFSFDKIAEIVKEQTAKYNWQFVFLGANMDSVASGCQIGIRCNTSINWNQSPIGTSALYGVVGDKLANYRSGTVSSMDFTNEERTKIESAS